MERMIFNHLKKLGTYLCFEVAMPREYRGLGIRERVDLLQHDSNGDWRFYELKLTKSDFNSKCKHTFLGNFNYYVMPIDLYNQVKDNIPKEIGVYAIYESGNVYSEKKSKRQELKIDKEKLMFSFMQSLSREYAKYRKTLYNNNIN